MEKPSRKDGETQGSMTAFWVVIVVAALLLVAYLAKVGFGSSGGGVGSPSSQASRRMAPGGEVKTVGGGGAVDLTSLRGKVVVLHFWATWCPPCRAEFPEFARFAGSKRGDDEVRVLPISLDRDPGAVGPFLQNIQEQFPVYWDPGSLAQEYAIAAIPSTVIVDKKGRIAWRRKGAADWSSGGVPKIVEALVGE